MIEAGLWKNRDARPPLPYQPRYRRDYRQTDPEGRTMSFYYLCNSSSIALTNRALVSLRGERSAVSNQPKKVDQRVPLGLCDALKQFVDQCIFN